MTEPNVQKQSAVYLSIVIPAYNEEERLGPTLNETALFFSTKPYITEIIVVDDGSKDRTIQLVMRTFKNQDMRKLKNIRPYLKRHQNNTGKGASVRTGINSASGVYVLIIDADGATPISEFDKLHRNISSSPVVIGSRDLGNEDRTLQNIFRKVIGKSAKRVTQSLFKLPVIDTQCGFKLLECRLAKELAREQSLQGFGYDVEYLVKAHKKGLPIKEVGVRWHDKKGGKVRPIRDSLFTLIDLIKLRRAL